MSLTEIFEEFFGGEYVEDVDTIKKLDNKLVNL